MATWIWSLADREDSCASSGATNPVPAAPRKCRLLVMFFMVAWRDRSGSGLVFDLTQSLFFAGVSVEDFVSVLGLSSDFLLSDLVPLLPRRA